MKPTCLLGSLGEEEFWVAGGLSLHRILRGTRAYSPQRLALCPLVPPRNLRLIPTTLVPESLWTRAMEIVPLQLLWRCPQDLLAQYATKKW